MGVNYVYARARESRGCRCYQDQRRVVGAVVLRYSTVLPILASSTGYRRLERASTETLEKHYIMSDTYELCPY
eukprot:822535-Rhodomonas_salina.1